MIRFVIILLFFQLPFAVKAQDDSTSAVTLSFQYHPYDFFLGFGYHATFRNWEHDIRFAIGINRSIFQGRLYPKLGYQFGRRFQLYKTFSTAPFIRIDGSLLDLSSDENKNVLKWLEPSFGLNLMNGKRFQYGLSAGIGPCWEWNSLERGAFQTWNVFTEINFKYAF